jgi:hypothetical protein
MYVCMYVCMRHPLRPKPCRPAARRCSSFRDTADVIARQAFFMFLNVTANVTNWNNDGTECSLVSAAW